MKYLMSFNESNNKLNKNEIISYVKNILAFISDTYDVNISYNNEYKTVEIEIISRNKESNLHELIPYSFLDLKDTILTLIDFLKIKNITMYNITVIDTDFIELSLNMNFRGYEPDTNFNNNINNMFSNLDMIDKFNMEFKYN